MKTLVMVTLNYSIEEHTEQRTPDIYIWKITIQLTNVGLAHARPNDDNIQSEDVLEVDVDEVCSSLRCLLPVDSHFSAAGNGSHNGVL